MEQATMNEHPYCPAEDGKCQYAHNFCPGIQRERNGDMTQAFIDLLAAAERAAPEHSELRQALDAYRNACIDAGEDEGEYVGEHTEDISYKFTERPHNVSEAWATNKRNVRDSA